MYEWHSFPCHFEKSSVREHNHCEDLHWKTNDRWIIWGWRYGDTRVVLTFIRASLFHKCFTFLYLTIRLTLCSNTAVKVSAVVSTNQDSRTQGSRGAAEGILRCRLSTGFLLSSFLWSLWACFHARTYSSASAVLVVSYSSYVSTVLHIWVQLFGYVFYISCYFMRSIS